MKSPRRERPARRGARPSAIRAATSARAAGQSRRRPATAPESSSVPESLLIVTGLSGSGKSYVFKCLEDMGYLCVDNLPLPLVEPLLSEVSAPRVGVIVDVRNPEFASRFPPILDRVRRRVPGTRLIFLDASEEALIRRFSETRRPHPLSVDRPLLKALRNERALLEDVRALADVVVDTSAMTVHELHSFMQKTFVGEEGAARMVVSATSFGYKFGVPHDVDLIFDVRFLANPHFVPELKRKIGTDPAVAAYIEKDPQTGSSWSDCRPSWITCSRSTSANTRAICRSASVAREASIGRSTSRRSSRAASRSEDFRCASPTGTRPASEMIGPMFYRSRPESG